MKQQIEKPINALPDSGDNTKKAPVMKEKKERNYAWGIFVGLCLVVAAVIMIFGL